MSVAVDCAEPIPLSSRHWYTPTSCGVTSVITSEDPEIWKRCDGMMGSALNSHVMFGEGLPRATQVKRADEPGETSWLSRPSTTDAGSVDDSTKAWSSAWAPATNRLCACSFAFSPTKDFHSVVGADHSPLLGLSSTGVAPFIAPRHHHKNQVVVLSLVKRPRCDLLTKLKPFGCWCTTTRHNTFQRQRLWLLHQNSPGRCGVNYPHWGGGGVYM